MKKTLTALLLTLSATLTATAQQNYIHDTTRFRSLALVVDDDPLLAPVLKLGSHKSIVLSFDEMGHEYHTFVYHIRHLGWDWTDGRESIFESDYMEGINGRQLEDYEVSFNTVQLYTHYEFELPYDKIQLRLSGNYAIEIYDEDEYESSNEPQPVMTAQFCLTEDAMSVSAELTGNTDISFNTHHQQLSYAINYGSIRVADPVRDMHTVVMQNRRQDNAVRDLEPNTRKPSGVEYTHRRELIFPGTNEFHKFEIIDLHRSNLNIDNMRWYEPFYHATIYADRTTRGSYVYDEDANGGRLLRNAEYDDEEITSEYEWVHFTLTSEERLEGGDVYVCGLWTNGTWDPECRMTWNAELSQYEAAIYLKQGYYNYQYRQMTPSGVGDTSRTDGNFCETENEYSIFVYYSAPSDRYDRLVGYVSF